MAVINKSSESDAEYLEELVRFKSETGIPGYWDNLEENSRQWAQQISVYPFWNNIKNELSNWIAEFRSNTGSDLLAKPGIPDFIGKQGCRIKSKMYQKWLKTKNVAEYYDNGGPAIPKINDLVRTRISCKYIDGVEYMANKIMDLAIKKSLNASRSREGRLEGYFAQHINFNENVFYRFAGNEIPVTVTCEIQIATDLSTRIWDGTHVIYEVARLSDEHPDDWQWNPSDPRFISRQLGHMIHLADGLLVQLRERLKYNLGRQ